MRKTCFDWIHIEPPSEVEHIIYTHASALASEVVSDDLSTTPQDTFPKPMIGFNSARYHSSALLLDIQRRVDSKWSDGSMQTGPSRLASPALEVTIVDSDPPSEQCDP